MALGQADPRQALQASTDCLNKRPTPEQAAIASVISMSSHARLGNFDEARAHLNNARGFYADHLGLFDEQRTKFLREGCFIDDLQPVGDRDLQANPWLYFILGHGYGPRLSEADLEDERRNAALQRWAAFVSDNRERMLGVLAYLYFTNDQYFEAAKYLEKVLLISRRYHAVLPVRIELLWPRVVLGDCYWASDQKERAGAKWQSARSVELCVPMDSEIDEWERFAIPWIEEAKFRLAKHRIPVPVPEVSRKASGHLRESIEHLFAAEQFEARGVDLEELSALIRRAGGRYTAAIERAASALEAVKRLDPFAWAKLSHGDLFYWYNYENAKGALLQKTALAHLANERLEVAIASYKQAMDFWPTLSSCALMGGLQAACGLFADARATYQMCFDRAEEFGAVESSDDRQELLLGVQEGLSELTT